MVPHFGTEPYKENMSILLSSEREADTNKEMKKTCQRQQKLKKPKR